MMIIGVCGRIASGKSFVMRHLAELGFKLIFCDEIVKELYVSGSPAALLIAENFGTEYLSADGSVDKFKLRSLVFDDHLMLRKLNDSIHPLVFKEVCRKLEYLKKNGFLDIAIEASYFEGEGLGSLVDSLLWVERSKDEVLNSLAERSFSPAMAEAAYGLIECPDGVDYLLLNEGDIFAKLQALFLK